MLLGSLKNFVTDFQLLSNNDQNLSVEGITDTSEFLPHHIIFIKNKFFLNEYLNSAFADHLGVILDRKFHESLEARDIDAITSKALWLATVQDVNLAMSFLSKPFYDEKIGNPNDMVDGRQMGTTSIHPSVWIAQGVFIGERVSINANVKIHSGVTIMSGVSIDEGCEIFPNTTIYRNVKIGNKVRIHANCVIGADGFGYNFSKGVHHKVWHTGSVVIGDDVEIGAGTCIDSGTFSPTYIGNGSKIDNQVQIGHNCKIGTGVILCGQAGVGGSTVIGDYTVLGGAAMAANGMKIGKAAQIAGASAVTSPVGDGEVVAGFPARDIKEWLKGIAYVRRLSLANSKDKKD